MHVMYFPHCYKPSSLLAEELIYSLLAEELMPQIMTSRFHCSCLSCPLQIIVSQLLVLCQFQFPLFRHLLSAFLFLSPQSKMRNYSIILLYYIYFFIFSNIFFFNIFLFPPVSLNYLITSRTGVKTLGRSTSREHCCATSKLIFDTSV